MDLFQHASDDAIALACCCGALLLSGSIMFFSKYLNPAAQQAQKLADRPQLRLARPDFAEHTMSAQEKAA
ncbi:MAG: hypothetical protein JWN70_5174 [Planctomycetaceae bacterium]|nr:hypothetical protein [Planctomycetaceae bacterium]